MARRELREEAHAYARILAERLWSLWRGRRITLDRYGRPNYIALISFLTRACELCLRYGVDPLHKVDWEAILTPT